MYHKLKRFTTNYIIIYLSILIIGRFATRKSSTVCDAHRVARLPILCWTSGLSNLRVVGTREGFLIQRFDVAWRLAMLSGGNYKALHCEGQVIRALPHGGLSMPRTAVPSARRHSLR